MASSTWRPSTKTPSPGTEPGSAAAGRTPSKAFAARQWTLGEKLSYRGISVITGGGSVGDGGYAGHVLATFTDGTRQPMTEAKFVYDCASHAFAHVVIVSAKAAQAPNLRTLSPTQPS